MEYNVTLKHRCGVVNMYNNIFDSLDCLKGTVDQMLSALGQNLNLYIIRNHVFSYQLAQKIVLNLGCCRKSDLNLLESQFQKQPEHLHLLFYIHWIDQCLIAIAQIHAAPHRCMLNLFVRPFTLRVMQYRNSFIFFVI